MDDEEQQQTITRKTFTKNDTATLLSSYGIRAGCYRYRKKKIKNLYHRHEEEDAIGTVTDAASITSIIATKSHGR
jgi:hypothetical protein